MTEGALQLLEDQVDSSRQNKRTDIIKPNFGTTNRALDINEGPLYFTSDQIAPLKKSEIGSSLEGLNQTRNDLLRELIQINQATNHLLQNGSVTTDRGLNGIAGSSFSIGSSQLDSFLNDVAADVTAEIVVTGGGYLLSKAAGSVGAGTAASIAGSATLATAPLAFGIGTLWLLSQDEELMNRLQEAKESGARDVPEGAPGAGNLVTTQPSRSGIDRANLAQRVQQATNHGGGGRGPNMSSAEIATLRERTSLAHRVREAQASGGGNGPNFSSAEAAAIMRGGNRPKTDAMGATPEERAIQTGSGENHARASRDRQTNTTLDGDFQITVHDERSLDREFDRVKEEVKEDLRRDLANPGGRVSTVGQNVR